jgi:aminoglycoside 6-adenylyltransferase
MVGKQIWDTFLQTYPSGQVESIWKAVIVMCDLFNNIAESVSYIMEVKYNQTEANNSLKFLKDVYVLPKNAKEIYE